MLNPGDIAPDFSLPNGQGSRVSLKDFAGRWLVLYFYPKDNTSGCTNEALDFTDLAGEFKSRNAAVLGVSPDSSESHRRFIERHGLGIELASDPDKTALGAYGAWGTKINYGREYQGVIRSTVLIAPDGTVARVWSNVKVRTKRKSGVVRHADTVLAALEDLTAS